MCSHNYVYKIAYPLIRSTMFKQFSQCLDNSKKVKNFQAQVRYLGIDARVYTKTLIESSPHSNPDKELDFQS